jgi:hypothetical protein
MDIIILMGAYFITHYSNSFFIEDIMANYEVVEVCNSNVMFKVIKNSTNNCSIIVAIIISEVFNLIEVYNFNYFNFDS